MVYTHVFGDRGELRCGKHPERGGWKPVVLTEVHAALHPKYEEYKSYFLAMPTLEQP